MTDALTASPKDWLAAVNARWHGGGRPAHLARHLADIVDAAGVVTLDPATARPLLTRARLVRPGLARLLGILVQQGFLTPIQQPRDDHAGTYRLVAPRKTTTARPVNGTLDTSRPHSARVWNYWLGGKDNFGPDRELGDHVAAVFPDIVDIARASRHFLARAVRYLSTDAGITQFLDIGTGLPTAENTHEVAQRINPRARIVYVDNDPLVLVHARALLTSHPDGITEYLDADVRDVDTILVRAARTLDLTKPVALMMLGILGNIEDYDEARAIVTRFTAALPSGSYLVVNDGTNVINSQARNQATRMSIEAGTPYIARHPDQIAGYFIGLQLIEPGVVSTTRWRPEPSQVGPDAVDVYCGIARIP
jgi:hypothetical protein